MIDSERYTLGRLAREVMTQTPRLVGHGGDLFAGLTGSARMDPVARLAVQLRLARLLGCPVCAATFPSLGRALGMDREMVAAAAAGQPDGLEPAVYGAVEWAGAILMADGAEPDVIPEAARQLDPAVRAHMTAFLRLELVVHATGLLFVPHSVVEWIRGP